MKHVPNILTLIRLAAIVPLLLLEPLRLPFMIIYVIAGLTDILDGPIARKFNSATPFGATLDGIADLLLVLVVLFRLFPIIEISTLTFIGIIIVVFMKLTGVAIGLIRHQTFILLHTYANKFFVFSLFLFPVFYSFMAADLVLSVLILIAMAAFSEDIFINLTSSEVNLDDKGIFFRGKIKN